MVIEEEQPVTSPVAFDLKGRVVARMDKSKDWTC